MKKKRGEEKMEGWKKKINERGDEKRKRGKKRVME